MIDHLEKIRGMYRETLGKHGDSPSAVMWPKGRQTERFHALTRHISREENSSLLDFGCGLAHLKPYLDEHYPQCNYCGADILSDFIDISKKKYLDNKFYRISSSKDLPDNFDYVVASGVFNIRYFESCNQNRDYIFSTLKDLLSRSNKFLSVNFMTDQVDFQQEGSWHQNFYELYEFLSKECSSRLVLDQSYMPYEYTVTVWKDVTIQRPENIYGS